MATKKKAKGGTKKSAGKKAGAKKGAKKKAGTKKGAAKKASKKLSAATATAAVCTLTAMTTTLLVGECAPQAPDIGATLEGAGLITEGQRSNFGDCVFQRVLAAGCLINRGDIPTDADTTLRDVVFAVLDAI